MGNPLSTFTAWTSVNEETTTSPTAPDAPPWPELKSPASSIQKQPQASRILRDELEEAVVSRKIMETKTGVMPSIKQRKRPRILVQVQGQEIKTLVTSIVLLLRVAGCSIIKVMHGDALTAITSDGAEDDAYVICLKKDSAGRVSTVYYKVEKSESECQTSTFQEALQHILSSS